MGWAPGKDEVVHRTVHTALPAALVCGAVLTVVGVLFSEDFLRMMGTPADVLPLSAVYMRIYFCGIIFTMVYNFCASILRAAGDTQSPLIFLFFAGIINVVLNVIFVTRLHMNVAGVALATTISQGVSAVLVVLVLMRRTDACKLCLSKMRFYRPQRLKMIRIGLPAGIQGSLFSISNVIIQSSVNSFGKILMSGNAAAQNLEGFVYVSMNSFQQTAVNFIGQNMGACQYSRVRKTLWYCLGCVLAVGLGASLLVYAWGPGLLSIYNYRLCRSHFPRNAAPGVGAAALFSLRSHGCIHRRSARHGRIGGTHDHLHSGRVRDPHWLDQHHFPDPSVSHAPVSVSFLSHILVHHLRGAADGILCGLPEAYPKPDAHRWLTYSLRAPGRRECFIPVPTPTDYRSGFRFGRIPRASPIFPGCLDR